MRDGHRKHHLVNDKYSLGFTVPFVDDLWGTNPSVGEACRRKEENGRDKWREKRKLINETEK